MPSKEFYQRNKETYLKRQRDFYGNNKEMVKERARIKYHSLSPEEKDKRNEYPKNWYSTLPKDKKDIKRAYAKNKYHNMIDEEMQKHKEYQKTIKKCIVKINNRSWKILKRNKVTLTKM